METGRKILILLFAILLVTSLMAVVMRTSKSDDFTTELDLYYLNESSTSIQAEKHKLSYNDSSELANLVLEELSKKPSDSKNSRVINKHTDWEITYNAPKLNVDFTEDFLSADPSRNLLATYAVVKSLCRLDGILSVKVTVNGNDIIAPDNTPIDYLSDKDINLESDTHTSENRVLKLYFSTNDARLLPEYRTVKLSDTITLEHYIVSELIKGPTEKNLSPTLSSDTMVISAESADGTAYINMSQSFIDKNSGTPDKEQRAVYSIVNSVCEVSNVNDVQILIEGKKVDGFSNVKLSETLHYNQAICAKQ